MSTKSLEFKGNKKKIFKYRRLYKSFLYFVIISTPTVLILSLFTTGNLNINIPLFDYTLFVFLGLFILATLIIPFTIPEKIQGRVVEYKIELDLVNRIIIVKYLTGIFKIKALETLIPFDRLGYAYHRKKAKKGINKDTLIIYEAYYAGYKLISTEKFNLSIYNNLWAPETLLQLANELNKAEIQEVK